jgi:hypothetical protein
MQAITLNQPGKLLVSMPVEAANTESCIAHRLAIPGFIPGHTAFTTAQHRFFPSNAYSGLSEKWSKVMPGVVSLGM